MAGIRRLGQIWTASFLFVFISDFSYADIGTEQDVAQLLPEDYQKNQGPSRSDGKPVNVSVRVDVNGIYEVNNPLMSIRFGVYFKITWRDHRLLPLEDPHLSYVPLQKGSIDHIWTPDPYIEDVVEVTSFKLLDESRGVFYNPQEKEISVSIMLKIQLSCPMSFHDFPFDEQECLFIVASYRYPMSYLRMRWGSTAALHLPEVVRRSVTNYDVSTHVSSNQSCACVSCDMVDSYPCVKGTLVFRRRFTSHLLTTYAPSSLFVAVAWVSFFWPADVIPGRTGLVVTALLTVISMFASSRQGTPETSYVKALDVWMFMCILLTTSALFQYALVLRSGWNRKRFLQEPPSLAFALLAWTLHLKIPHVAPPTQVSDNGFRHLRDRIVILWYLVDPASKWTRRTFLPETFLRTQSGSCARECCWQQNQEVWRVKFLICSSSHRLRHLQTQAKDLVVPVGSCKKKDPKTRERFENERERYENYERYCERAAVVLLPVVFVSFNIIYWPFYLGH
ncbi:glycine receptor subunit alpha-4-like [Oratosquilla oratoria]|uniref:glycine receptor subunit alpha-4-like n=1 Tax=Oratosquilla oratoria TaxID=337810 RepID=UPI003F77317B